MAEPTFEATLATVIEHMCSVARSEAQKTEPWKNLFASSEHGLQGLLSETQHQMNAVVHNTIDVIKQKFEIKRVSNELYDLIKLLPYAGAALRESITKEQGNCCCADKTRRIYYEQVLAEIEKIKAEQTIKE